MSDRLVDDELNLLFIIPLTFLLLTKLYIIYFITIKNIYIFENT